jgi:acetyl-CoA synthetase
MESPATTPVESRTRWTTIVKRPANDGRVPNVCDYGRAWSEFSWGEARRRLDGLPGGRGLNIAHEAIDRHTAGLHGNRLALRWVGRTGTRRDFTFDDLRGATNRFANVLRRLGVGKGDVVATLAGRIPSLYVAAFGALKNGSVYTPLFSAFGPDPIVSRMTIVDEGDFDAAAGTESAGRSASASGTRRRRPFGC